MALTCAVSGKRLGEGGERCRERVGWARKAERKEKGRAQVKA